MRVLTLLICSFLFALQGIAQDNSPLSPIIFIYDASGSMWGQMNGKTKKEIASSVLSTSVSNLPDEQKIGLVAYGHRKKGDCTDVEFLVDVSNGSKTEVTNAIQSIQPLGRTPLAYSAKQVIDQLRTSKIKATIILITDGIESCDGNICDVVEQAKREGIDFILHIIGFGLKSSETEQLKCAAKAGDGKYYNASDAGGLGDVLDEATGETIDKPKGNVSVFALKNGIAIDAIVTAYDVVAKREPISVRTYKDTAYFYLPPSKYNLEARPLEGSDVDAISIVDVVSFEEKIVHQDISFDGGKIGITTTNNGDNWDCIVKVIDQNKKVAASVRTYKEPKEVEINPGTYKVTILGLGSMNGLNTYTEIENVTIRAGAITPISYNFESGTVFIDAKVNGQSIDSVVTIYDLDTNTNIAGGRTYDRGKEFLLNPGEYKVKIAPTGKNKDRKSQILTIDVKKGELITKTINF